MPAICASFDKAIHVFVIDFHTSAQHLVAASRGRQMLQCHHIQSELPKRVNDIVVYSRYI